MYKNVKKSISLLLSLALLLTLIPMTALATGTLAISVDASNYADGVDAGEEISLPVVISDNPGIAVSDLQVAFDATAFEIVSITKGTDIAGEYMEGDAASPNCVWTDAGGEDSTATGTLFTVKLKVLDGAAGTYAVTLNDNGTYNANGDPVTPVITEATITIGTVSNDPYTANISTTDTEFKVDDTVTVTVNVGGTIGSFASSEVTLTYDSTYLTFNEATSTLNEAGVDTTTANTIKLVDHGEDNAYPVAYVLNFTAKQATSGAAVLVTLTDARFSTAENAVSSDLIEATGENALSLTIKNADLNVTLPASGVVIGNNTVPYGDAYTFTAKNNTTYMYYDYEVSATMGGTSVDAANIVNNNDGTWTIANVTGDLMIAVTETPKTYNVTVNGDTTVTDEEIAKVTTTGVVDGKATYNTALTYTLPAGQDATDLVDGYHYTATVTVGGNPYTASANDLTYTIAGANVTGDIVITLSKVPDYANSVKVTIKDSNEVQKDGQTVTEFTATKNSEVELTLVPEAGYTYVISDGTNELPVDEDNKFTVSVGETAVEITVTKTLDTSTVSVQEYLQLNGTVMWLVTINGNGTTEISGKTYTYNSDNMFWSSKYQAYCCLEVAETLTANDAKAKVGNALVEADAVDVEYNKDVNNTNGKVDANDAQLVYNMYQTKAYDSFANVEMIKFLEADLNATVGVDSTDAQVIIDYLLNKTT